MKKNIVVIITVVLAVVTGMFFATKKGKVRRISNGIKGKGTGICN